MTDSLHIAVPWDTPGLHRIHGSHPMPRSLLDHPYPGYRFDLSLAPADKTHLRSAKKQADRLRRDLARVVPRLTPDEIEEYIASRDLTSQAMMQKPCDVQFLLNAPMSFNSVPWFLHLEETLTLFYPFLWHGLSANVAIREKPIWRIVKHLLESPQCLGIFSHLRHSADWLPVLFDNEQLRAKSHYVPLGIEFGPANARKIAARQQDRGGIPGTTFLFTNSWSGQEASFVLRGGNDVIRAFIELVAKYPDSRLIVLSRLPTSMYGAAFAEFVRGVPNLHVIDNRVSDDDLVELMMSADVFLVPSVGLHALSILRAMYCGLALVVSDAPGNDEFVTHDRTGVAVVGRRGKTAWYDEIGFLHQTFEPVFTKEMSDFSANLYREMERLVVDPERRRRIGAAAREHVLRNFDISGWRDGFGQVLDSVRRAVRSPAR